MIATKKWTRGGATLLTLFVTAGIAFAAPELGQKSVGNFDSDDGTYAVKTVTSDEACEALCKAESHICRGTVTYQPDTTKPERQCRLNNGLGENPVFPPVPPETLDFDKALADLNAYRVSKNLPALQYDERLNRASEVHVRDLASADILSHTGTDGSGHGDRVQRQGYYFSIAGENVATGQTSWEAVFNSWKKSPGHNENLLRDDVSEFGLALVYEPKTSHSTFWAMLVADPINIDNSEGED